MIALLFSLVLDFKVPVDLYYEPYKEKEILMAVNRKDKRSKRFAEKVKKWNEDNGVQI